MGVDYNIRIAGGAGQGVRTAAHFLSRLAVSCGYHFHTTHDYMSRIRGGRNSASVRIGSAVVRAGRETADILLALDPGHLPHFLPRLAEGGVALSESQGAEPPAKGIPMKEMAVAAGGPLLANMAGVGVIVHLLGIAEETVERLLETEFPGESGERNRKAVRLGTEWGREHMQRIFPLPAATPIPRLVMDGNEALALGAIAGGCKFASGYPMTPGSGILSVLADEGPQVGLLFEQAEDEIAALNMAIGASCAGARAMTATSGGGFALMTEALSLAGMIEAPVTIAVGMRPGPATGMPTRTEQADLDFVLSAGHGEFPRLVLAPGSPEEAFDLAQHAMDTAERYQVPVILLTDQYLADSVTDVDPTALVPRPVRRYLVRGRDVPRAPGGRYARYAVTANGVSPQAVPGEPGITVVADSDEHTPDGHLTEDHAVRREMVRKRLRKGQALAERTLSPLLSGPGRGSTVLIGFGSTRDVIDETRRLLSEAGFNVSAVHLRQVWPFPAREMTAILTRFGKALTVENNAEGQLARLIRRECGLPIRGTISRYDGLPFTPDRLAEEARQKA